MIEAPVIQETQEDAGFAIQFGKPVIKRVAKEVYRDGELAVTKLVGDTQPKLKLNQTAFDHVTDGLTNACFNFIPSAINNDLFLIFSSEREGFNRVGFTSGTLRNMNMMKIVKERFTDVDENGSPVERTEFTLVPYTGSITTLRNGATSKEDTAEVTSQQLAAQGFKVYQLV